MAQTISLRIGATACNHIPLRMILTPGPNYDQLVLRADLNDSPTDDEFLTMARCLYWLMGRQVSAPRTVAKLRTAIEDKIIDVTVVG